MGTWIGLFLLAIDVAALHFPTPSVEQSERITSPRLRQGREEEHARSCNRFCYVHSMKPLDNLPSSACSHIVIQASLTALGKVKLTPEGTATAKWLLTRNESDKPKLIVSVGSHESTAIWRSAVSTRASRAEIIEDFRRILKEWGATGVELSWTHEPLLFPTDSTTLRELLREMREKMDAMTIALAVTHQSSYSYMYDGMLNLDSLIDYLILHAHKFHDGTKSTAGHFSPLFACLENSDSSRVSMRGMVAFWRSRSIPRDKIVPSISTRPLSQMLTEEYEEGKMLRDMATQPYTEHEHRGLNSSLAIDGQKLCKLVEDSASHKHFSECMGVPFIVNGRRFVSYENERSVQMKTSWISLNHLGGVAIFDAQLDDAEGGCSGTPFPLLRTIQKTQVCPACKSVDLTRFGKTRSCYLRLPSGNATDETPITLFPFKDCSQVVVEVVKLDADGTIQFIDETAKKAMNELGHLRLKRILAVVRCDHTMSGAAFEKVLEKHSSTVRNLLAFVANYSFSGIELACDHSLTAANKPAFATFLSQLRSGLSEATPSKQLPYRLSVRIPITTRDLTIKYDVGVLNSLHSVVMTPFTASPKANTTSLTTPLFDIEGGNSVDGTLRSWADVGLDKAKVILLISTEATLQTFSSSQAELGAPTSDSITVDQNTVCSLLNNSMPSILWDRIASYAIVNNGTQFLSMETQESVAYKVYYAIRERLGGTGFLLNYDDINGRCGLSVFPLFHAAEAKCVDWFG